MEAQERIAEARSRRGASEAMIDEALAISEPGASAAEREREDDNLYVSVLSRYVTALGGRLEEAALGGHLELRAVFPEETIVVGRENPPDRRPNG